MEIRNKICYKIDKSLQLYYGRILEYKFDKIKVSKFRSSDMWGDYITTWIEYKDIVKHLNK